MVSLSRFSEACDKGKAETEDGSTGPGSDGDPLGRRIRPDIYGCHRRTVYRGGLCTCTTSRELCTFSDLYIPTDHHIDLDYWRLIVDDTHHPSSYPDTPHSPPQPLCTLRFDHYLIAYCSTRPVSYRALPTPHISTPNHLLSIPKRDSQHHVIDSRLNQW